MFLSKNSRLKKWSVAALSLFFVWMVFICAHNANPADHSNDVSVNCDMSTVVSQVTCTKDSSVLLALTVIFSLGFAWTATGYPRHNLHILHFWYVFPITFINRPIFSLVLEMFRRGITHPKLYSF